MIVDSMSSLVPGGSADAAHIDLTGPAAVAASAFDIDRLLAETAAYAVAAADHLAAAGRPPSTRSLDLAHVLSFCTTHCEVDGAAVPAWAPLSGVYETRGGRHIQLHCNFAHHAAGVVAALGTADDRPSVAAAIRERDAFELEAVLIDAGLIGAAIRTLDEWDTHDHARATVDLPVISVEQIGDASPIESDHLNVLDCSRVLAGPVAGSVLASYGADVLRLGADHLPSVPVGVMTTGFGKRNASVDLRNDAGKATMADLLSDTDVWIDAFRPGALASHGFTPERAAALRPGVVAVQLSAFDWVGPWAGRRGFDSIVQSTTGVRWAGGAHGGVDDGAPVGLPVQALDYATGFLAAGVASQLVQHQRNVGGSWLARLSLLRTRNHLVGLRAPGTYIPAALEADPKYLATSDSDFGRLTTVKPFAGEGRWPSKPLGSSPAEWLNRRV